MEYMDQTNHKEIRHQYDSFTGILYVSIVDVIKLLRISTDSRNYWKTLKNRLKTTHPELVTTCNQLRMRANDGKMYLTDTTDSDNCLLLIQQMAPERLAEFRKYFKNILDNSHKEETRDVELSTEDQLPHKIKIDLYKIKDMFILKVLLSGVAKEDIFITASCKNILLQSKVVPPTNFQKDNYTVNELVFGKYAREINLPEEIEIEKIQTFYNHGLLEIHLPILDKSYTRIIKVK